MWDAFVPAWSKSHRVIRVDLPGHGASTHVEVPARLEDTAKMIQAQLLQHSLHKAILMGHSLGGYIALALASLQPDDVKAVILMQSTAMDDTEEKRTNRERAIKAVKYNKHRYISGMIRALYAPINLPGCEKAIERHLASAYQLQASALIGTLEAMKNRPDCRHLTSLLPTYYLIGEDDPILRFTEMKKEIAPLPPANITIMKNVGHMSHIENPALFKEVTLDLLSKLSG